MNAAQQYVWWVSLALQALLCLSLLRLPRRNLRFFRWWLLTALLRSLALTVLGGVKSSSYFLVYVITEPVLLGLLGLTVKEAYAEQTRAYAAMGRVGHWLLHTGLTLAAISGVLVFATQPGPWPQVAVRTIVLIRLGLVGFLAAFTACSLLVFTVWRPPSSKLAHYRLLTAYLILISAGLASANWLGQEAVAFVNVAMLSAVAALWLVWAWALRSEVETEPQEPTAGSGSGNPELAEQEANRFLEETRRAASGR